MVVRVLPTAKEGHFRPGVDVLFRSTASIYGHRVVGVVLPGTMDDGTNGLRHLSAVGGLTVVQDPRETACQGMPGNAILGVHVRSCLRARHRRPAGPAAAPDRFATRPA